MLKLSVVLQDKKQEDMLEFNVLFWGLLLCSVELVIRMWTGQQLTVHSN